MESLRYPSTNEWLMKMCYTHNENLFSCKENEIHRKNGLVLDNSILGGGGSRFRNTKAVHLSHREITATNF